MKDDLAVLKQARALIAEPKDWCSGDYVKNGRHCALGAIFRVATGREPVLGAPVSSMELEAMPGMRMLADTVTRAVCGYAPNFETFWAPIVSTVSWTNDNLGHTFILAAFDTAIAKLEARREAEQNDVVQAIMQTALDTAEPTLAGVLSDSRQAAEHAEPAL